MNKSIGYIFCVGVVLLLACRPLVAITNPAGGASEYAKATKLLTQGKNFVEAIALLQEAVRAQPKNPNYHLALGCAYADRAASINLAGGMRMMYTADKASYPSNLANWQKAQQDPKNRGYGDPRPTPPPSSFNAYTKDDGKPLTLSDSQAQARGAELNKEALAEWEAAITFSKDQKQRAWAEYTKGWGVQLMNEASSDQKFDQSDRIQPFQAATHDNPTNAAYWESLGFASGEDTQKSVGSYRRALALRPNNPRLWFELSKKYRSDIFWSGLIETIKRSPSYTEAVAALKAVLSQNPKNAFPIYTLAYLELEASPYTNNSMNVYATTPAAREKVNADMEASLTAADKSDGRELLALMDEAGRMPDCFPLDYCPPVPALLKVEWNDFYSLELPMTRSTSYMVLRGPARDAYGVAITDAIEHDLPGAIRTQRIVIRMGYQLAGPLTVTGSSIRSGESINAIFGFAVTSIGYRGLISIEQKYGTPAQVAQTQAEYDAFEARVQAYKALLRKNSQTSIYAQY